MLSGFLDQSSSLPTNYPTSAPSTSSDVQYFFHNKNNPASAAFHSKTLNIPPSSGAISAFSPRFKRPENSKSLTSPDGKRRRTNSMYQTPFELPFRRPEPLPRPEFMPPQKSGSVSMGPPPPPQQPLSSLTLAPLQSLPTILDSAPSTPAKSLEAMVMSIPILSKIRVLSQISPPLPQPKAPTTAYSVRGFVIAIDGPEPTSVTQVTEAVSIALTAHHPVRIFRGPLPRSELPSKDGDDFQTYLDTISQYHTLSSEITSYITTTTAAASPISPKAVPTSKAQTRSAASQKQQLNPSPTPPAPAATPAVPIALIPSFQLSHTDAAASQIQIQDAYAPADHWQWMATLWRGIVGPDVTVAMVGSGSSSPSNVKIPSSGLKNNGGGTDIQLEDSRAILIQDMEPGAVAEGPLRRVCFELSEYVRGT